MRVSSVPSCLLPGEPTQRSQSRHEAILTATSENELRDSLATPAHRFTRNSKTTWTTGRSGDRIPFRPGSEEDTVVYPLRLHELELPADVSPNESEHQPAIGAIVVKDAFRQ